MFTYHERWLTGLDDALWPWSATYQIFSPTILLNQTSVHIVYSTASYRCGCVTIVCLQLCCGDNFTLCVSLPFQAQKKEARNDENPVGYVGDQRPHRPLVTPPHNSVQDFPDAAVVLAAAVHFPDEMLIVRVLLQLMNGPSEKASGD